MNQITITGNLVKDPRLDKANDKPVGKGSLAVARPYNRELVDFFDFDIWGNSADYFVKYAKKGDRLEIVGFMESHKYENKNGEKVIKWVVRVDSFQLLPRTKVDKKEKMEEIEELDDDMPF